MNTGWMTDDEYYGLFRKPTLASGDFFRLLFAQLHLMGIHSIPRDFTAALYKLESSGQYDSLFAEIHFRDNGVFVFSDEVEDSMAEMQTLRLAGKTDPASPVMNLYFDPITSEEILREFPQDIADAMGNLAAELAAELETDKK